MSGLDLVYYTGQDGTTDNEGDNMRRGICSTCKAPVTETADRATRTSKWLHDHADDDYTDPVTGERVIRSTPSVFARHSIVGVEAVA